MVLVRALTDDRFRDRNAEYLKSRFGDSDTYCILTRVPDHQWSDIDSGLDHW